MPNSIENKKTFTKVNFDQEQLPLPSYGKTEPEVKTIHHQLLIELPESQKYKYNTAVTIVQDAADKVIQHNNLPKNTYGIYLSNARSGYSAGVEGYYYIVLDYNTFLKSSLESIISIIAHEYIGHTLLSCNEIKKGQNLSLFRTGLQSMIIKRDPNGVLLRQNIGSDLDEAVTVFLSVLAVSSNEYPVNKILGDSPCMSDISKLIDLIDQMELLEPGLGNGKSGLMNVIKEAKKKGQIDLIIKFLKQKTNIALTPHELFALDFSRVIDRIKQRISS